MNSKPLPLMTVLQQIEDPRRVKSCDHLLIDILMIAICAIMCGADTWQEMEEFGKEKEYWLKRFLKLPSGIPSHDTFYRLFCLLAPETFQACFTQWVKSAFSSSQINNDDIIPIDGKAIKGSRGKGKGKRAVHLVSAWSTQLGLVIGQKAVDKKSNEITAVPDLLQSLDLRGCLITADALHCQKLIAETCITEGAHYLLAVKGNQELLHKDIDSTVEDYWSETLVDTVSDSFFEQENHGHGRYEHRRCWIFNDLSLLSTGDQWPGLAQFGVIQADRTEKNETTTAFRYYITSQTMTAEQMLNASRSHWEIENNLHWALDVSFNEDQCQTKNDNAAENLSTLRKITLNVLKTDKANTRSIKSKRKKAGWSNTYLFSLVKKHLLN